MHSKKPKPQAKKTENTKQDDKTVNLKPDETGFVSGTPDAFVPEARGIIIDDPSPVNRRNPLNPFTVYNNSSIAKPN